MLLSPNEINVESLMADLPMQRSRRHQLEIQLMVLQEGLTLGFNPVNRTTPIKFYTVGDFETLPIISNRLWNTPDDWRLIATANKLEYPFVVIPGQKLIVPERDRHS